MNNNGTFLKKIEYLHIVCLHTSYIKVHTHEICKYGMQKSVKTLIYNGMNFDKSRCNRYRNVYELCPPSVDTAGNNGSQDCVRSVATTFKVNGLGFESQQR